MTTASNHFKTAFLESIIDSVRSGRKNLYYFIGRTNEWGEDDSIPGELPTISGREENEARKNMVFLKKINHQDIALLTKRIDWKKGESYDAWDDAFDNKLKGINLTAGGNDYTSAPSVTITAAAGDAGAGAKASAEIEDGRVTKITLTEKGNGYKAAPTVTIEGGGGTGARAVAVISDKQDIKDDDIKYYVLTNENNVYKCVAAGTGESTYQPHGTSAEPVLLNEKEGYEWIYLYTINAALRNKFLSNELMPVFNDLREQYYSNGRILSTSIITGGKDYTWARVSVTGNGYNNENPVGITGVKTDEIKGGSGYTLENTEVTIDSPVINESQWIADSPVVIGGYIANSGGLVYEVVKQGTTGETEPTHTSTAYDGTTILKYVARKATATPVINSDGEITDIIIKSGEVTGIEITESGSGYISKPTIKAKSSNIADIKINEEVFLKSGAVTYAKVSSSVSNLSSGDPVTIIIGNEWAASTAYTANEQVFNGDNLYTVTTAGTSGAVETAPTGTDTETEETSGTAGFTYAGKAAKATPVIQYGYGYKKAPEITITSTDGTGAEATLETETNHAILKPEISNGAIESITVENGGIGYTHATVAIEGDGNGAEAVADLSVGNINSIQAINSSTIEGGKILRYEVISNGYGYKTDETLTVTVTGDGTGATATATIPDGNYGKIKVTAENEGSGYTFAEATITGGSGHGAVIRPVISPIDGHGKNPANELLANSLMFYSDILREKIGGFEIKNNYRQVGIVAMPEPFSGGGFYGDVTGTTCYVVTTAIDIETDKFNNTDKASVSVTEDDVTGKFRIIEADEKSLLVLPLDGGTIKLNSIIINKDGDEIIASSVTPPDIDKYTGDILFIENKPPFKPGENQDVTLKTIIKI